jgi:5-methylcytosine-specific restriction endonuclease McrA
VIIKFVASSHINRDMDKALLTNKKEMEKLYLERKMSCNEIRKQMHTTNAKVMQALVDLGIPVRTLSEEAKLRSPEGKWKGEDNPSKDPEVMQKILNKRRSYKGKNNPNYGKSPSKETRAKMRTKKLKSHTPLYKQIRNSVRADIWSRDVLKRDDYTCQHCGVRGTYLHAHHLVGFKKLFKEFKIKTLEQALKTEELWELSNGLTLCKECHKETDNYGGKG